MRLLQASVVATGKLSHANMLSVKLVKSKRTISICLQTTQRTSISLHELLERTSNLRYHSGHTIAKEIAYRYLIFRWLGVHDKRLEKNIDETLSYALAQLSHQ